MRALRSDRRKTAMSESCHRMTGISPARSAHGSTTPGGALAIRRSRFMRPAMAGFILFLFAAGALHGGSAGHARGMRGCRRQVGPLWPSATGRSATCRRRTPARPARTRRTAPPRASRPTPHPSAAPRRSASRPHAAARHPSSSRCAAARWRLRCAPTEPYPLTARDRHANLGACRCAPCSSTQAIPSSGMDYAAVTSALAARDTPSPRRR